MSTEASSSAFPYYGFRTVADPEYGRGSYTPYKQEAIIDYGVNKREYFAVMALQGLLAANTGSINNDTFALLAVGLADSLISQLNGV